MIRWLVTTTLLVLFSGRGPAMAQETTAPAAGTAVLEVDLVAGATVTVGGRQYPPQQRRFTFQPLEAGRVYVSKLTASLPGGGSVERQILLSGGRTIRLAIPAPGQPLPEGVPQIGHPRAYVHDYGQMILSVQLEEMSPDGKFVLSTSSYDPNAILWEADTGRKVRSFRTESGRAITSSFDWGREGGSRGAHFADGGRRVLVVAPLRQAIEVFSLDTATGKQLGRFRIENPYMGYQSPSFSEDGGRMAVDHYAQGSGSKISVWDTRQGTAIATLDFDFGIHYYALSPDGTQLLIGAAYPRTEGGSVPAELRELPSGRVLQAVQHGQWEISVLAFSRDGKLALSGDQSEVRLWETATGRQRASFSSDEFGSNGARHASISPRGDLVIVNDVLLNAGEARPGDEEAKGEGRVLCELAQRGTFTPDGGHILTGAYVRYANDKLPMLWRIEDGGRKLVPVRTFHAAEAARVHAIAYSRPSGLLAVAVGEKIAVWDLATGQPRYVFDSDKEPHWRAGLTFTPDGKSLVSSIGDNCQIWETATGKRTYESHDQADCEAVVSPNGQWFATCNRDGMIATELSTGRRIYDTGGDTTTIVAGRDNRTVVLGDDNEINVIDVFTPKYETRVSELPFFLSDLDLGADGRTVYAGGRGKVWDRGNNEWVSGDTGAVAAWDLVSGKKVRDFPHSDAGVSVVAVSPDGSLLAAGLSNGHIALWDAQRGTPLRTLSGHYGRITSLDFGADRWQLFSSSEDGSVRFWDLASGAQLAELIMLDGCESWLVYAPDGLFDGNAAGRERVAFQPPGELTVVPVDRFFQDFFRPGLLAQLSQGERPQASVGLARSRPPEVRIVAPAGGAVETEQVTVEVEALDQGGGVRGPWLMHNGARLLPGGAAEKRDQSVRQRFAVRLVEGENRLEARAASSDGSWESEPAALLLRFDRPLPKPALHLVAVGVNRYAEESMNLQFAAPDARAIVDLFRAHGTQLYGPDCVHATLLVDQEATQAGIREAMKSVAAQSQPQDVLVVFLAGHGMTLGQNYYFVPHEFRNRAATLDEDLKGQALAGHSLGELLVATRILKRVLIFDTCQSGAAVGLVSTSRNPFALRGTLERMNDAQGVFALAAAAASADAQEVPQLGHGVLTYCLLAAFGRVRQGPLESEPLQPRDAALVDVREWFQYAQDHVPVLTRTYFHREQYVSYSGQGIGFPLLPK